MTRPMDLIAAGFPSDKKHGKAFGDAVSLLRYRNFTTKELESWVAANKPHETIQLQDAPDLIVNLEANTPEEITNRDRVIETMGVVMRTPTVVAGAVMPDACPAGPLGTIPVGGVVAAKGAIHVGMHSADICCSMMVSEFKDADPLTVLNAIHQVTHFGYGGRPNGKRFTLSPKLYQLMTENYFMSSNKMLQLATEHMGTQGDGNHFSFVGINNAGNVCLVTHHGSRGVGAFLYSKGMKVAQAMTHKIADGVLKQNTWIPSDTSEGDAYWEALQLVRKWTKANHSCLHAAAAEVAGAKVITRLWNEHNFVFREDDIFYHAKGATPIHDAFLPDTDGVQIVPLNMKQPVLLIEGTKNDRNLGFAPHGAGRNLSRTAHKKTIVGMTDQEIFDKETSGVDARFWCGNIDITELPSAYKDGPSVRKQMEDMGLAKVVDEIQPYGSIMAGDQDKDAPWRIKRDARNNNKGATTND
jgi:tRNA-splicing ligase RtcB